MTRWLAGFVPHHRRALAPIRARKCRRSSSFGPWQIANGGDPPRSARAVGVGTACDSSSCRASALADGFLCHRLRGQLSDPPEPGSIGHRRRRNRRSLRRERLRSRAPVLPQRDEAGHEGIRVACEADRPRQHQGGLRVLPGDHFDAAGGLTVRIKERLETDYQMTAPSCIVTGKGVSCDVKGATSTDPGLNIRLKNLPKSPVSYKFAIKFNKR